MTRTIIIFIFQFQRVFSLFIFFALKILPANANISYLSSTICVRYMKYLPHVAPLTHQDLYRGSVEHADILWKNFPVDVL